MDILSSSSTEDRRVYFDGLMALQLELQKKALFNTNAAQLNTLDDVGDSSSRLDDEEEVPISPTFLIAVVFHLFKIWNYRVALNWICLFLVVWK